MGASLLAQLRYLPARCCPLSESRENSAVQMLTGILIIGLAACAWFAGSEWIRLAPLRKRHDHQALWMTAVRPEYRERLDALLSTICDAFIIPLRYRFHLRPSDSLETLYKRNMRGQFGDSLEYENLAMQLEQNFGLEMKEFFDIHPCTIRTLVRTVIQRLEASIDKTSGES